MARIKDEDVALVRERVRIDEVVGDYVSLKAAGGGSLKGLCPFHDERSPSFHVTPAKGLWHCFGCQAGGDVIDFLRKIDQLTFAEAVEKLAARGGVQLRYEEGGAAPGRLQGQRTRLIEAHRAAADFYREQLARPGAMIGREFLAARGFDRDAAEHFGVGFAPAGWDALTKHLRQRGFTDDELVAGGLAAAGQRGPYDRFRGRLTWPIRDVSGDVIGFGARRLLESDEGPKYLNTPETPLYRKSQVLYGVDLARREISRRQQAVIVEGYTDVMACHLSGLPTAVATCGTAFGADHVKLLRRLLMDQDEFRGEVVFTFDGDAAGRKAALRAFNEDQRFVAQTFVAVDGSGLDPCELRQQHGPEAVRELVARRVPMFEFAIRATLAEYNLDTPEGRVAGLRAAAPVVARIRDQALRPEYTRLLAGWLGMEPAAVAAAVTQGRTAAVPASQPAAAGGDRVAGPPVEREALKCALQIPHHVAAWYASVEPSAYTSPSHAAIHAAIAAAGGPMAASGAREWVESVRDLSPNATVRTGVTELAVEPLRTASDDDEQARAYGESVLARLLAMDATRRVTELKARLQRINPLEHPAEYNAMFADLMALEQYCRGMREHAAEGS